MASFYRRLIGFYVPFLVLYWLALLGVTALLIWWLERSGSLWIICLLLVAPGVAFIQSLWTCRLLLRYEDKIDDPLVLRVPRELLTELHEIVEEVVSAQGAPVPHEVRLTVDVNAGAFEEKGRRRVLVLGCPMLMLLSEKALSGVIAHELGHFAAGDTHRSWIDRGRIAMMGLLESKFAEGWLLRWNPLIWVLRGYHWLCFLAWAKHSRDDEFRADHHSVRQVGKKEAAATLIYLTVPGRLPYARLDSIAESFAATEQPLEDLFAEQRQRLKSISPREWEEALGKELKVKTEHFDSHPCLRDRLKAIGVSPRKALVCALQLGGPPVAERLKAWPGIEKILSRRTMALCREYYQSKMEMAQIILGGPFRS
jgi:Zn-dependent protease with chaperone function